MDLPSLIIDMRKIRATYKLTATEQALFYEIVALWKSGRQQNIITISNNELCTALNINKLLLIKSRKTLLRVKLIAYKAGSSKSNVGQYSFGEEFTNNAIPDSIPITLPNLIPDSDTNLSKKPKSFIPPSLAEVEEYCKQRNSIIDASMFTNFYTSKNWMIGRNKMKDWRAAIRTWEQKEKKDEKNRSDNSGAKDYTKGF